MRALSVVLACGLTSVTAGCASRGTEQVADVTSMGKTRGAVSSAVGQTYRGMEGAMSAPLRDLNVRREAVPVILLAATDAPYQTRTAFDCPSIAAEVAALNLALGPDLDVVVPESERDYYRMGAEEAADAALDSVRDMAEGMLPVRSWVRRLSGARRAEKHTQRVIQAGAIRRAFLKGIGDHRGCPYPASPMPPMYARDADSSAQDAAQTADGSEPPRS